MKQEESQQLVGQFAVSKFLYEKSKYYRRLVEAKSD